MRKYINRTIILFVIMFFIFISVNDKTLSLYSSTHSFLSGDINVDSSIGGGTDDGSVSINDSDFIVEIVGGQAVIVGVKEGVEKVVIPSTVYDKNGNVYKVTKIDKPDDGKWEDVKFVAFSEPSNITFIGKDSMEGMEELKTLILPSSIITIEESAILCLESMEWIVVPNSVKNMGKEAFKDLPSSCKIYCVGKSKPKTGWSSEWVKSGIKVYWGEGVEWKFNNDGVPVAIEK